MRRPRHLLFVCSGNICRSPMAEALAVPIADRLGLDVRARSAGTLGIVGRPADPKTIAVCREVGVDCADHRSQGLDPALVLWADHILVMEFAHAAHLREYFPDVGDRLLLLGSFIGEPEIPDPIGGWTWQFRRTRKQLEAALEAFLRRLA